MNARTPVLALMLLGAVPGLAQTSITVSAQFDTRLEGKAPSSNYGHDNYLNVSANSGAGKETVSLITFDLSTIPPGSVVSDATLSLYVNGGTGSQPCELF